MLQASASRIRKNPFIFSSCSQIAVFFYCAISLAPVQVGVTCNTYVTGRPTCQCQIPRFPHCNFNTTNLYVSANKLSLSLRIKSLMCLHRLILRKRLQASCFLKTVYVNLSARACFFVFTESIPVLKLC